MRPAANPFAVREYGRLERLTPRALIWRNIVNSTVFIGSKGLAVVDTQVNQALARRLLAELTSAFPGRPLLYAINTHYHWDHTSGNAVFKAAGATLVASRRTARAMVERALRQKDFLASRGFELGPDPDPPQLELLGGERLDLGDLELEFTLGAAAETADPTLVWCPQERVLASGDTVMTGSFPIFGQPSQREGLEDDGWLAALDQVRAFAPATVSPGHGPPAGGPELAALERIMRYFLAEVRRHHAAGLGLEGTIQRMEEDMPAWITRIPEVWGTPRYAILRVWAGLEDLGQPGWQHRKPSAVPRPATLPPPPAHGDAAGWSALVAQAGEGGDLAQAVGLSEAATAALPDDPAVWTLHAQTLIAASRAIASVLEKGDCFALAKQAIGRALALRPGYAPALLQLGQFHTMMAYRNGDDPRRGEELLAQAAADPALDARQRAEIAFYQAIAARTRGDEAAAAAGFARALRADPSFRPALIASMA
jgi:glyoxylase-like metal-dependent hydrolase (beta-lactamase superfamily II)